MKNADFLKLPESVATLSQQQHHILIACFCVCGKPEEKAVPDSVLHG